MKPLSPLKLLNNAGLGLVEVMVAGSIAMIVIFGVGRAIIDSQRSQKSVQLGQNIGFVTNQLASMFTNDCPMSAAPAYVYNSAFLATPQPMNFGTIDMGGGPFTLAAGSIIPKMDLQINSLRLQNLSDGAAYTTGGIQYQTHNAALSISFTKLGDTIGVKTGKEVILGVSLVTQVAGNLVTKCSFHGSLAATSLSTADYTSVVNEAARAACESGNGVWIPATPTLPAKCDVGPGDCKYYGSYAPAAAGAGAYASFVNPFTGGTSCPTTPAGIIPYQQGVVTTAVSCGKSCVRSVFTPIMTCMKCGGSMTIGTLPSCGGCNLTTHECVFNGSTYSCVVLSSTDPTSGGLFP